VTKTVGVSFNDRLMWVYDEPLGVLLKYMIDTLTERGLDVSDSWAPKVRQWRATAVLGGNVGLDLDCYEQKWQPDDYSFFCQVVREAAERAAIAGPIPVEEVAGWHVLDDLPPVIRSASELDTGPCVVIGEALVDLVMGRLPVEPAGETWFVGFPGGTKSSPYRGRFVPLPDHLLASVVPPGARAREPMIYDLALADGRVVRALLLQRTQGRLGIITDAEPPFESADIERLDSYYWEEAPSPPR